jgi:hypothetical protein
MEGFGGAAKSYQNLAGLFGGGGAGAAGGTGVGAAGGVSTAGAAGSAGGASTAGASSTSIAPYAGPAIALGAAGYGEYQAMKDPTQAGKYTGDRSSPGQSAWQKAWKPVGQKLGDVQSKSIGLGLTETPDRMGAMERRYTSQQTAMNDINEARKALNAAGLPTEERRSISQKLELARQKIGGPKRGATGIA